jgi:hypothetical protein
MKAHRFGLAVLALGAAGLFAEQFFEDAGLSTAA